MRDSRSASLSSFGWQGCRSAEQPHTQLFCHPDGLLCLASTEKHEDNPCVVCDHLMAICVSLRGWRRVLLCTHRLLETPHQRFQTDGEGLLGVSWGRKYLSGLWEIIWTFRADNYCDFLSLPEIHYGNTRLRRAVGDFLATAPGFGHQIEIAFKVCSYLFRHFDPSTSSVHNFSMPLLIKFDGKILIYIKFCIPKSILKLFGVYYFWGAGPSKPGLLAGSTPNA